MYPWRCVAGLASVGDKKPVKDKRGRVLKLFFFNMSETKCINTSAEHVLVLLTKGIVLMQSFICNARLSSIGSRQQWHNETG